MSVHIVLLICKLWSADSVGWTGLKWPCIACWCSAVHVIMWPTSSDPWPPLTTLSVWARTLDSCKKKSYDEQDKRLQRQGVRGTPLYKKFKKISRRNLPNVRMAGWRHWLTKYTNKESKFHNIICYISHNHLYIHLRSSEYYCANQQCCEMCSPCLCTYFVCQCLHPAIPTFARFIL